MKKHILNIIKFGVPAIVMFMIIYAIFFVSNAGSDAEFGAIGASDGLLLLLVFFVIIYFVVSIIVWIISKNNFLFLSAIFSIIITIITMFVSLKIDNSLMEKRSEEYYVQEKAKDNSLNNKIDSLTKLIVANPNNGNLIAERVLLKKELAGGYVSKELLKEFELAAINKSSNFDMYNSMIIGYYGNNRIIIKYFTKALEYDSLKQINFSEYEKNEIAKQLKYSIEEENRIIKQCNEEIDSLNISNLTKKAHAYHNLGQEQKAFANIDKALSIDSVNYDLIGLRADFLADTGGYNQAITIYKYLLDNAPNMQYMYKEKLDAIINKTDSIN